MGFKTPSPSPEGRGDRPEQDETASSALTPALSLRERAVVRAVPLLRNQSIGERKSSLQSNIENPSAREKEAGKGPQSPHSTPCR
jgi:hypothetical protein